MRDRDAVNAVIILVATLALTVEWLAGIIWVTEPDDIAAVQRPTSVVVK